MERKLVKGGIYSFIVGLLIGIVVFPDKETINLGRGLVETNYIPLRVYVMQLVRFSALLSILTIVGIGIKEYFTITNRETGVREFVKGFVKAFFIVLVVIVLALLVLNLITTK
ncbi:hypothetical protein [Paenibacillus turpanensis]|uniref:hypothetical protein n=1 Tax=Paenibacillus turpanensis TaxID=2689078 RepID=UPI001A9E40B8|nr:hypothetical protein [Paenibacillus turpanensis]